MQAIKVIFIQIIIYFTDRIHHQSGLIYYPKYNYWYNVPDNGNNRNDICKIPKEKFCITVKRRKCRKLII